MPLPVEESAFLQSVDPPPHSECVAAADKFLGLTGMSVRDLAEAVRGEYGRCGRSTLLFYFRGEYGKLSGSHSTRWLDARVWDYVQHHWPRAPEAPKPPEVLKTQGYWKVLTVLEDALESGAGCVIYGPPSAEKSELLQHFVYSRLSAGCDDAAYLYCGPELASPFALLRALARVLGVCISRSQLSQTYADAILKALRGRQQLPVVVFDEAQRLELRTLETIIGLHDRTRRDGRRGFGFILAGSHKLSQFLHARRPEIEQLLSRIPHRLHLTGMTETEALELAARALGNGSPAELSARRRQLVLARSRVLDTYAPVCSKCSSDWNGEGNKCDQGCVGAGPQPREYYSSRRLLEYIRQQRNAGLRKVLAPNEAVA